MKRIVIVVLLMVVTAAHADTWRLYRTSTSGGSPAHVATFDSTSDTKGIEGLPYNHRVCLEVRDMYGESNATKMLGLRYWCEKHED